MPNLSETVRQRIKSLCDNKLYLTGNYTTAFNLGKQQEVEKRFKHSKLLRGWKE